MTDPSATNADELDVRQVPKPQRHPLIFSTATDVPRILGNASAMISAALSADAAGAVWKLEISERQLDANIIHLQPGRQIEAHIGPDLDVFMYVLTGDGRLATETDTVVLDPGCLVWLPRRSQRSITAGPTGLSYLTVHPRRPALTVDTAPAS